MTWPGGPDGTQDGTQGGQPGDDPTQRYQGSYANPFDQQPDQAQQPGAGDPTQRYQGSYANPFDATQQVGADQTTAYPQQGDATQAYQQPGPYQPGWEPTGPQPQQPYGQQGAYGQQPLMYSKQASSPYGVAPPPQEFKPGKLVGVWIGAGVVGVVLLLAVVVGVVLLTGDDDEPPVANPTTTVATTQPPPSSGGPSTTEQAPTSTGVKPEPVVPGWQVVLSSKRKLAYDVPPEWTVLSEDTIIGFENAEGPQVGMTGAAQSGRGFCPDSETAYRVGTGLTSYRDSDLALAASDAAGKWGRFGYLGPNDEEPAVEVSAATPTSIAGVDGVRTIATVSGIPAQPCSPQTANVHTAAIPNPDGGSFVFVIISDQGVPEGIAAEQADQIIASIRFTG